MFDFAQPTYLILLVPILGFVVWVGKKVQGVSVRRRKRAIWIRALLCSLLVLALAEPERYHKNRGIGILFLVDRSASISDSARKNQDRIIKQSIENLGPDDVAGIIAFGSESSIETTPSRRPIYRGIESRISNTSTDLASAIRLASAAFQEGKAKRAIILSDGNETSGDARQAAEVAASDQISIDWVKLEQAENNSEVLVSNVEVPSSGQLDQPFDLRVSVDSIGVKSALLKVDRNGVIVSQKRYDLQEGRNNLLIPQRIQNNGLVRYRVTLESEQDTDPRNNIGAGFINIQGRPKVLLVQQDANDKSLFTTLKRNGIEVDLGTLSRMPTRAEQLQAYESIVFNNIEASKFPIGLQPVYAKVASDSGIGLAMVGGENSFLPGGWYGSPITDALPIDLNIRQKKTMAAASVLIIADCSGSMSAVEGGQTKLAMASRAAEETIKMLGPMDRVGVIGSSNGIELVVPMTSADNKEAAIQGARKLAVNGGGIYIGPSIAKGEQILSKEPSKTRHLIILADGADSTDWEGVNQTVAKMRAQKITTSVVAIGDGSDVPMLRKLAAFAGGRFYLALRANQLPAIFTQDTAVMSRSAIEEGQFLPKFVQSDEVLRGTLDRGTPPLLGYCLVESKPLSKVILRSRKDDPILVTGRSGLATTMAFTSDAKAQWAKYWLAWEGFDPFWAQLVRGIGKQATQNRYVVQVDQSQGKAKIRVTGTDPNGNPLNAPDTPVRVSKPNGESQELTLTQVGPGQFESEFEASEVGSYIVSVVEKEASGKIRVQSSGTSVTYPAEYRVLRPNLNLLQEVAKATRGKELTDMKEAFRAVPIQGESRTEIFHWFLLLAALVLPLDIAHRRIVVPLKELFRKRTSKATRPEKPTEMSSAPRQTLRRTAPTLKASTSQAQSPNPSGIPSDRATTSGSIGEPQDEDTLSATEPATAKSTSSALLANKRARRQGSNNQDK